MTRTQRLLTAALAAVVVAMGASPPPALGRGSPYLVKDINTLPVTDHGSTPSAFTLAGGTMFFVANDGSHGSELWKTDGTDAGTVLVKDINPGSPGSGPASLTAFGDALYFVAADAFGLRLWRSDGTEAGTVPLTSSSGATRLFPVNSDTSLVFAPGQSLLYFVTRDSGGRSPKLWRTDGTTAGTLVVFTNSASDPFGGLFALVSLATIGDTVFFAANAGAQPSVGNELCRNDGTPGSTTLVADLQPGQSDSHPGNFVAAGGKVFFTAQGSLYAINAAADQPVRVIQGVSAGFIAASTPPPEPLYFALGNIVLFKKDGTLWRSDGTIAGTFALGSTAAGPRPFDAPRLRVLAGLAYFVTITDYNLWRTDGTVAGTLIAARSGSVVSLTESNLSLSLGEAGGRVYEVGPSLGGSTLQRLDPAGGPPVAVRTFPSNLLFSNRAPRGLSSGAAELYFSAADEVHGRELWRSDGTEAGTVLLKNIGPDPLSKDGLLYVPPHATVVNDRLYFAATDSEYNGYAVAWESDGTPSGTRSLSGSYPITLRSSPGNFTPVGSATLFTAYTGDVWRTDGVSGVATPLAEPTRFVALDFASFGPTAIFAGREAPAPAIRLYRTDGTAAGTGLLKDITLSGNINSPVFLRAGPRVYFSADDGVHGWELWSSDGTAEGTRLVADLNPGSGTVGVFFVASTVGGDVFAAQWNGTTGLYRVNPGGGVTTLRVFQNSGVFGQTVTAGGRVFFSVSVPSSPTPLPSAWVSDGTAEGTYPDPGYPGFLGSAGDRVIVRGATTPTGAEPFVANGTPGGATPLRDINPGPAGSSPELAGEDEQFLYFRAFDPATGSELWRTDGTPAGTVRLTDVRAGPGDSFPASGFARRLNSTLLFSATDGLHGVELWALPLGSACPADLDGDGEVNANDLSAYLNAWYTDVITGTVAADFDGSGETDANDISAYLNGWYAAVVDGGRC